VSWKSITTPLDDSLVESLRAGDTVLLSGVVYTARDRAHERLIDMARRGERPPFETRGQVIYYAGPSPTPPGKITGSVGPTTSYRMDPFTGGMLEMGIRGLIGKGRRGREVRDLLTKHRAVYFSAFGGVAAYLSRRVVAASLVAFEDFGPEAVYRYELRDFPLVVANDIFGGDLYESPVYRRA